MRKWGSGSEERQFECAQLTRGLARCAGMLDSAPELQLLKPPRVVKATREVPLKLAAKDDERGCRHPAQGRYRATDGGLRDGCDGGWAAVLPKSLHILPAAELQFWVKAAELGI